MVFWSSRGVLEMNGDVREAEALRLRRRTLKSGESGDGWTGVVSPWGGSG